MVLICQTQKMITRLKDVSGSVCWSIEWHLIKKKNKKNRKTERQKDRDIENQTVKSNQVYQWRNMTLTSGVKKLIIRTVDGFLGNVMHTPVGSAVLA